MEEETPDVGGGGEDVTVDETPADATGRGRGFGKPFKGGCPPGPGRGNKKAGKPAPPLLRAMRRVLTQEHTRDRDSMERECREWLREDRKGFFAKMATLEGHESVKRAKREEKEEAAILVHEPESASVAPPPEEDVGSERVEDLIERLLREANDGG